MSDDIKELTRTLIQTRVIQAFKDAPEAIDALVVAALSQEVNQYGGKPEGYYGTKMPYLEFLVGQTIRAVATGAVKAAVEERQAEIEAAVRRAVSADALVDSVAKKMLGTLAEDWKLQITFANEKPRD
jgi:hypothetical protein